MISEMTTKSRAKSKRGNKMQLRKLKFKLTSEAPLLLHNGSLADPFNYYAKEMKKISGKRGKTEAEYEALGRLEFLGGLYLNLKEEVVIPGRCVEAMLKNAAKAQKLGKVFDSSVFCEEDFPLIYKGPKKPEKLWEAGTFRDVQGVVVDRKRIMRTRPRFDEWALDIEIAYLEEMVNEQNVVEATRRAGMVVGLGDCRPRYGRFSAKKV